MLTQPSMEVQWAHTSEGVDAVHADATVMARIARALIEVGLAVRAGVASVAFASVSGVELRVASSVVAEVVATRVCWLGAVRSSEAVRALAGVGPKDSSLAI